MKPVRRLREPSVEVPWTEGSTKAPWRVHEASTKGPWRNFVGFLHDYHRDPMLLPSGSPFKCHEEVLYLFAAYDPT